MKLRVIYVPGLGDKKAFLFQKILIRSWRAYGVKQYYFRVGWVDDEPFDHKLQRLLDLIDQVSRDGSKVGIIGASAGAGLAVNAFAARQDKVVGVVSICGKIYNLESIAESVYQINPAFKESLVCLQDSLHKIKGREVQIRSVYSSKDQLIPNKDSIIAGAENKSIGSLGHATSIVLQITKGARANIAFLKNTATKADP